MTSIQKKEYLKRKHIDIYEERGRDEGAFRRIDFNETRQS